MIRASRGVGRRWRFFPGSSNASSPSHVSTSHTRGIASSSSSMPCSWIGSGTIGTEAPALGPVATVVCTSAGASSTPPPSVEEAGDEPTPPTAPGIGDMALAATSVPPESVQEACSLFDFDCSSFASARCRNCPSVILGGVITGAFLFPMLLLTLTLTLDVDEACFDQDTIQYHDDDCSMYAHAAEPNMII